jgi:hypothetical protein
LTTTLNIANPTRALQVSNDRLNREVVDLRRENQRLRQENDDLRRQLSIPRAQSGQTPPDVARLSPRAVAQVTEAPRPSMDVVAMLCEGSETSDADVRFSLMELD